jgi:hypothetical protein
MGIFSQYAKAKNVQVMGVVTNSVEFQRIFGLPRRALDFDSVEDVTPVFARPEGKLSFRPIQSAALIEASLADGLFAPIAVGAGKTLIALALPEAMDSEKTVLLVKPSLKKQLEREALEFYDKHFKLPLDRITIVAYSELSSAKHAGILDELQPDLIIADEAHALKNSTAARTKRFLRYAKNNPGCRYAFLSGTMTHRSVQDYAHLIELALRKNSPLPRGYRELKDWAGALDVEPDYIMEPGVLRKFCTASEHVRDGYRRRLVETRGVVATSKGAIGTSLVFRRQRPKVPKELASFIGHTRDSWALGEREFESAATMAAALKQLAHGFYYRWVWPDGVPDDEWLEARRNWNREVRQKLARATKGMDSPLLLARAAERYRVWDEELNREGQRPDNAWDSCSWAAWKAVKDREDPPVEPVWLDDFIVDYAASWAKKLKGARGIIWYSWQAVGERIATKHGLPLYGPGRDASEATEDVIVCSIRSQGTGKNLQRYSHNLFLSLPPNGSAVEQTVGRTHRPGQEADVVIVDWLAHTPELADAIDKVIQDAEYIERTTGQRQKVLYCTHIH